MDSKVKRFWEIDFFRGLAVLMMLAFHFLYDLDFFRLLELSINSGPLLYVGRSSAVLFILISGTALSISYSRQEKENNTGSSFTSGFQPGTRREVSEIPASKTYGSDEYGPEKYRKETYGSGVFRKYLKRGLKLFSLGLLLTAVSRIFMEERYIAFGILHFFGVASVLAYPLLPLKKGALLSGVFFTLVGFFLRERSFYFSTLLWLGFRPEAFRSLDYFPIFPWFGVLLLGLYLGNTFYPESRRLFTFPDLSEIRTVKYLCAVGRHSLFIYFIHQPLFLAALYLCGFLDPNLI